MGTFVTGNTPLPPLKTDSPQYPPTGLSYEIDAADINNLWNALSDLRDHVSGNWVNVKSSAYGAKGDNFSNDTSAILAAYNAVKASGGTLFFPSGVYLFNLSIVDRNISVVGAGRGGSTNQQAYQGGSVGATTFRPWDKTKPVIQIGDGTTRINAITLSNFTVLGDSSADASMVYTAGTSTSDGIVQVGAHYVNIVDVDILYMGGDGYRVTSGVTQPSFWTNLVGVNVVGCGLVGLHFVYGPQWVTTINIIGGSAWSLGSGANTYAVRTEGVGILSSTFWAETQVSGHLAYLDYDTSRTIPPGWAGSGTTNLDSGTSTDVLMEINTTGSAVPLRRTTTLFLTGLLIDGQVKWTADGVSVAKSSGWTKIGATEVLGQLGFNANLNASNDEPTTPTRIFQGGGTTGTEFVDLSGASFRVPGTVAYNYKFANSAALWRDATGGQLRWFSGGSNPVADANGLQLSPLRKNLIYSASMALDASLGTWFYIAATNATAFSIGTPSNGGTPLTNITGMRMTLTISNQSVGALGVATFPTNFKMAAWTQPAVGFSRSIDVQFDGTNWIEVGRTPADVPN